MGRLKLDIHFYLTGLPTINKIEQEKFQKIPLNQKTTGCQLLTVSALPTMKHRSVQYVSVVDPNPNVLAGSESEEKSADSDTDSESDSDTVVG
jgi:hypothetical protein